MKLILLDVASNQQQVQEIWCDLAGRCSNSYSYFLSWGWIEHWLVSLPANSSVKLAVFYKDEVPALAFFVGKARQIRHHLVRSRALFFNATGIPRVDLLYIEYNAILSSTAIDCSLQEILELMPCEWDEFVMPGLDSNAFPGNAIQQTCSLGKFIVESEMPSPYVDLNLVRQSQGGYLSLLNKSTRSTITRSYKGYEERGTVTLEVAQELSCAIDIFDEMVQLHRETWKARNKISAFISEFSLNFHKELIHKRFVSGEVQLLRIRAGESTVGCLYNFIFQGKVYFYQSGFRYESEGRLAPGYTCLTEAIKLNADLGHDFYDFLASNDSYKSRLATHENRLLWVKLQKPRAIFHLEDRLKALKKSYSTPDPQPQ